VTFPAYPPLSLPGTGHDHTINIATRRRGVLLPGEHFACAYACDAGRLPSCLALLRCCSPAERRYLTMPPCHLHLLRRWQVNRLGTSTVDVLWHVRFRIARRKDAARLRGELAPLLCLLARLCSLQYRGIENSGDSSVDGLPHSRRCRRRRAGKAGGSGANAHQRSTAGRTRWTARRRRHARGESGGAVRPARTPCTARAYRTVRRAVLLVASATITLHWYATPPTPCWRY